MGDKERQTERGVGGGRRVVPQRDHSWCLTPLVLLMCDAQEIDRLCKTQPTRENNNNTSQAQENSTRLGCAEKRLRWGSWMDSTTS